MVITKYAYGTGNHGEKVSIQVTLFCLFLSPTLAFSRVTTLFIVCISLTSSLFLSLCFYGRDLEQMVSSLGRNLDFAGYPFSWKYVPRYFIERGELIFTMYRMSVILVMLVALR